MIPFIEDYRMDFGVGSICKILRVAPSSYYANLAIRRDPLLASNRARQDVTDSVEIRRVHDESRGRYGARKVWHQLRRESKDMHCRTLDESYGITGPLSAKLRCNSPAGQWLFAASQSSRRTPMPLSRVQTIK